VRIVVAIAVALLAFGALASSATARKPIVAYVDSVGGAFRLYDAEAGAFLVSPPIPANVQRFLRIAARARDGRRASRHGP
jgi:hypothetical protein